ncbi:MAG: hypothetical protein AB1724_18965 [Thermodesulfobacteriota bacterium]
MKIDHTFPPGKHYRASILLLSIALIMGACSSGIKPSRVPMDDKTARYDRFLQALDKETTEAGVNNAAVGRLDGLAFLRADRFLCGLKDRVSTAAEKDLWIDWMRAEDAAARCGEILCLPAESRERLSRLAGVPPAADELADYAETAAAALLAARRKQPDFHEAVTAAMECPQVYETWMRAVGAYPLTALPVVYLTRKAHRRMSDWLSKPPGPIPPGSESVCYLPEKAPVLSEEEIGRILSASSDNALAVPRPDTVARRMLAENFAPTITQEISGDSDRFGTIQWRDKNIRVDEERSAIYWYCTNAFYRGKPVLQINYAVWYAARQGPKSPWLERGPLDGLTVRVTLDGSGRPVMADIMNNCGCYHFFVPAEGTIKRIKPQSFAIDAFSPMTLPSSFPENRLNVHVNADWHQVVGLTADPVPADGTICSLVPYETLEMLPTDNGGHASLFNTSGIAKESTRIEPYILFSMGIPKVGSMRQRGHHALTLVGRSYFSDPDLMDKNFEYNE